MARVVRVACQDCDAVVDVPIAEIVVYLDWADPDSSNLMADCPACGTDIDRPVTAELFGELVPFAAVHVVRGHTCPPFDLDEALSMVLALRAEDSDVLALLGGA